MNIRIVPIIKYLNLPQIYMIILMKTQKQKIAYKRLWAILKLFEYNTLFIKRRVQDLNLRAGTTGSPDFESGALPLCQLSITVLIISTNIAIGKRKFHYLLNNSFFMP